MLKVANVVGARPQFIKYASVLRCIEKINAASGNPIANFLIHTGQHYDYMMSEVFFDELGIGKPNCHLGVGSSLHGTQTAAIMQKVEEVFLSKKPDILIVYGDTNSTLGAALTAAKLHIPVVHVEAGLRSFNKDMPEEINRVLIDHVSSVLFCPSELAMQNLQREGFSNICHLEDLNAENGCLPSPEMNPSNPIVFNVGDVMYDALLYSLKIAEEKSDVLERLGIAAKTYDVLTMHRAENTDNEDQFRGLIDFVNRTSVGKAVLFPMHPRTRKVYEKSSARLSNNIRVIEPIGYLDLLMLVKQSNLVMTDSGGLQKEAYWLKVPCITLRDETEWVETIESGWNVLYRDYEGTFTLSRSHEHLYGDGNTSGKIVETLLRLARKK